MAYGFITNRIAVPTSFFLFHRHRDICVRREPNLVALHSGNQPFIDEVMMALMGALAAVLFRQLDTTALDLVDGTDMNAVCADDFHVLFDLVGYPL